MSGSPCFTTITLRTARGILGRGQPTQERSNELFLSEILVYFKSLLCLHSAMLAKRVVGSSIQQVLRRELVAFSERRGEKLQGRQSGQKTGCRFARSVTVHFLMPYKLSCARGLSTARLRPPSR